MVISSQELLNESQFNESKFEKITLINVLNLILILIQNMINPLCSATIDKAY